MLQSRKWLERILAVCVDTREYQAARDTTEYPGVMAEMEPKGIKEIQVRKSAFKPYGHVMYEFRPGRK